MTGLSVDNLWITRQQGRQHDLERRLTARCLKTINGNASDLRIHKATLPDVAWLLPAPVSVARNSPSEGGGLCGRNGRKIKSNKRGWSP